VRYDALIIGAGMSGLAAGIRLAQFDRRVAVLERHSVWGGLNSFYTLQGRAFDVGLHALTNWTRPGTSAAKGAPLTKLLRALRIRHEELCLGEQGFSEILFPSATLTFTNDFARLAAEVERAFPQSRDGFARLARLAREFQPTESRELRPTPETAELAPAPGTAGLQPGSSPGTARLQPGLFSGARSLLDALLPDPLLREMLLLPILFYGSAREDDIELEQFLILFKALFLEGLCRPEGGIRTLLNLLVKRAKRAGCELRMSTPVARIVHERGVTRGVELESGEVLEAETVFSSAGWVETQALAGDPVEARDVGKLSFLESIWVLDRAPAELGYRAATSFFSHEERVCYRRPQKLIDARSGVISSPNNFAARAPLDEGWIRVSVLANHDRWCALEPEDYARAKERAAEEAAASAARFVPPWSAHQVFRDVFTPRTIRAFTGHAGGAVYGSPKKHLDGQTGIDGLYLIGTDQGYLGVIGALVSGVTMANRHVLLRAVER
jgi:phytoene dehydrogenase-like protein